MEYWLVFGCIIAALLGVVRGIYLAGPPPAPPRRSGPPRRPGRFVFSGEEELEEEQARDIEQAMRDLRDEARRLGLLPPEEDATYQQRILHLRWHMWFRERIPHFREQIKEHAINIGVGVLLFVLLPVLVPLVFVIGIALMVSEAVDAVKARNASVATEEPAVGSIRQEICDEVTSEIDASVLAELEQLELRLFGAASTSMPTVETPSEQEENEQAAT